MSGGPPDWERAARRLAHQLAAGASLAAGGTRCLWFTLPAKSRVYAITLFEGHRVIGGGPNPEKARQALARILLRLAATP